MRLCPPNSTGTPRFLDLPMALQCSRIQCGGFQFLLILDIWGISFHAVVVFWSREEHFLHMDATSIYF